MSIVFGSFTRRAAIAKRDIVATTGQPGHAHRCDAATGEASVVSTAPAVRL